MCGQFIRNRDNIALTLSNVPLVRKRTSTLLVGGKQDTTAPIPSLERWDACSLDLTANCLAYAQGSCHAFYSPTNISLIVNKCPHESPLNLFGHPTILAFLTTNSGSESHELFQKALMGNQEHGRK